jgi:hypothetical protein
LLEKFVAEQNKTQYLTQDIEILKTENDGLKKENQQITNLQQNNLNQITQLQAANNELNKRPTQAQLDTIQQAKKQKENEINAYENDLQAELNLNDTNLNT